MENYHIYRFKFSWSKNFVKMSEIMQVLVFTIKIVIARGEPTTTANHSKFL